MAVNNKNNINSNRSIHENEDRTNQFNQKKKKHIKFDIDDKPSDEILINSCKTGNLDIIIDYLNCGYDVNEFFITGWNMMLFAASYAQFNIIQYLLKVGADIELHHEGYTPLMALCNSSKESSETRLRCLKLFLESNVNVNTTSKLKETALMYACKMQEIDFITELLVHIDNVNAYDNQQKTALFYAVMSNKYDVVKLLIEKGADITWISYDGLNAFDIAITKGYDKLLPLISCKSDVNEEEEINTNFITSWTDMFPSMTETNKDNIDNEILCILFGMGLESYKTCFRGLDIKSFLKLNEDNLKTLGINVSVHRSRFIIDLVKFHKHEWSNTLMKINSSEQFTIFEAIKVLGNINKQFSIISSSFCFAKNYLNVLRLNPEFNIQKGEKQSIKIKINKMKEIITRIKIGMKQIQTLSKKVNRLHINLFLPTYIENKNKTNYYKLAVVTFFTATAITILRKKI